MTPTLSAPTKEAIETLADLVHRLGDIPLERIRLKPPPGTATVRDVQLHKMCELVEGTLVEKAMGLRESLLAGFLVSVLHAFVRSGNLGLVSGPDGKLEILNGIVRLADV